MSRQSNRIPNYLDEPERFIFFTPDEAAVVIFPLMLVGVIANYAVGLLVAIGCVLALRRFKQGGTLARLLWRAYWVFPSDILSLKATPPSHSRYLAG